MGSTYSKSVSTYSYSSTIKDFSIHDIHPDERQLLDGLRSIILRDEILDMIELLNSVSQLLRRLALLMIG
jgi:hypothetical protein